MIRDTAVTGANHFWDHDWANIDTKHISNTFYTPLCIICK